mgnify:CR=1 FL=1|jgi:hypothetical protein
MSMRQQSETLHRCGLRPRRRGRRYPGQDLPASVPPPRLRARAPLARASRSCRKCRSGCLRRSCRGCRSADESGSGRRTAARLDRYRPAAERVHRDRTTDRRAAATRWLRNFRLSVSDFLQPLGFRCWEIRRTLTGGAQVSKPAAVGGKDHARAQACCCRQAGSFVARTQLMVPVSESV